MAHDVTNFGAVGDGETNCTAKLQAAIDACAEAGGGTVNVPAGRYVTGTLWFRSNVTIHLEAGATLLGSLNVDDFPEWSSQWEGPRVRRTRAAMLCGEGLENISITGRGTVDARGKHWWDRQRAAERGANGEETRRPLLFRVVDCRNVLVEGVTFRNSPMWTVSPLACDNVTISRVTVINPPDSPNTDGINPDSCRNVHISDCHVDVGDDCITIKSGKEDDLRRELRPCENITVTNCTLVHGHGGVVIGSEISGGVRNVAISNCVFVGTDRGIRIKARRGRGGVVEDVRVSNLVMDGVLAPLTVNLFYGCGAWGETKVTDTSPQPVDAGTPRFRRLRFSNITARNVKWAALYVLGLPEMFVDDVAYSDISIHLDPHNTAGGAPVMAPNVPDHCRAGIVVRNVNQLALRNIDLTDQLGPGVIIANARDVTVDGVTLRTPSGDSAPLISLKDVRGAIVRQCRVPHQTPAALAVRAGDTTDTVSADDRGTVDWSGDA